VNLILPSSALSKIRSHVAAFGSYAEEAGGFFLGPARTPRILAVGFALGRGVERGRGEFRVTGPAIERLFEWAESNEYRIWAQFHSHPAAAFLSRTDIKYGFSVKDFVSAVIPEFKNPPINPHLWKWWTYQQAAWREITPPAVEDHDACIFTFSEDGIGA
jgi:proteasome lid subunit RPN8/RPN11